MRRIVWGILTILVLLTFSTSAFALNYVYVGAWEVDQGALWTSEPMAFSGQQAAALLFGGNADDYAISTIGSDPLTVNQEAWYSVLGYNGPNDGGIAFADNYLSSNSSQSPGYYYSGNSYRWQDPTESASAFVLDNAYGSANTNYAFKIENVGIPEPASLLLLSLGLLGLAGVRKKFKK